MTLCLVSIGSNLGDREAMVAGAIEALQQLPGVEHFSASPPLQTLPVGGPTGQQAFINSVVSFRSTIPPHTLLHELQLLEKNGRRNRTERWSARTLDLDLLACGQQVIDEPELRVPHPRMTYRPFVLAPAAQIAPEWEHPELGMPLEELWRCLQSGRDAIQVIGPYQRSIAAMIQTELSLKDQISNAKRRMMVDTENHNPRPAKLTIDTSPKGDSPGAGPMLRLKDCPSSAWRQEVLAAIDCAWPNLTPSIESYRT